MAKASIEIVSILRNTAAKILSSDHYQWGHMGLCNCGFLVQQVTSLRKEEIHNRAMIRSGDWSDQLNDYCATSGLPIDDLITEMLVMGFDREDFRHLEKLSAPSVLRSLPPGERDLRHNIKTDVARYLRAWANLLEDQLVQYIDRAEIERAFIRDSAAAEKEYSL
jgi:hypothetical protein